MRKDVKIGLGIGGVLLAVLIVYLLVPKNNDTTEIVQNDPPVDTTGQGGAADTSGDTVGGESGAAGAGGANSGVPQDTGVTTPGTPDQGTVDNVAQGQPETGEYDTTAATTPKVDWETILVTGVVPEEAKIPLAGHQGAASDDIFASNPGNTGAEPDWTSVRGGGRAAPGTGANAAPSPSQNPIPPTPPAGGATGNPSTGSPANGPTGGMREHVIQEHETLSMIAAVAYGDARRYREILKANPGLDERRLRPGKTIKLPNASTFATAQTAAARQEAKIDPNTQYKVEQGDNLHRIAVKLYGKPAKADTIYELNKDKIGDEPSRLKLGTILKLPEPPAAVQSAR